jgi:hypothetical protein
MCMIGSTTGREARETKEMKQGKDEPSRSGPTRGRQQEERHAPVDSGASQASLLCLTMAWLYA